MTSHAIEGPAPRGAAVRPRARRGTGTALRAGMLAACLLLPAAVQAEAVQAGAVQAGAVQAGAVQAGANAPCNPAPNDPAAAQGAGCDAIRARVAVDAARAPWSAIGRIGRAAGRGGAATDHCTGVLVSRRLVLTAAHCLRGTGGAGWTAPGDLRFAAGYQRGRARAVLPVVRIVLSPAAAMAAPGGGLDIPPDRDWALLVLARAADPAIAPLPLFAGRLRLAGPGRAELAGYAGLRPERLTVAHDCGRPLAAAGRLMAACSAMPGDSGAPLLWVGDGDGRAPVLLGITTAISTSGRPLGTEFAPWFRLRTAIAAEIAAGN